MSELPEGIPMSSQINYDLEDLNQILLDSLRFPADPSESADPARFRCIRKGFSKHTLVFFLILHFLKSVGF